MSTTRLDEICIFLTMNVFTSKVNALGISNLPSAIQAVRAAWKDDKKKKQGSIVYVAGIFNSLVVVSGLTGRWPILIKTNVVANILNGVKESIEARKKAESMTEEQVNAQGKPRKRSVLSNAIKNRFFSSRNDNKKEDQLAGSKESVDESADTGSSASDVAASATTKRGTETASSTTSSVKKRFWSSRKDSTDSTADSKKQTQESKYDESRRKKTLVKAQALLAGKRESSMDDIIWGIFQISLVIFDLTRWQAMGRAWMVYLLHVLEETAFSTKLTRKQKTRKIAYLAITAYASGRVLFKQEHEHVQ